MILKLIPIVHLAFAIILYFYPFFIKKNFLYDYLYISGAMFMILSWRYFNGECPFSYLYKKLKNPHYKCGETTTLDDFAELDIFPKKDGENTGNATIIKIVDLIFSTAFIVSTIIVSYRSELANPLLIIFTTIVLRFFYLFFNNATGYDTNKFGKSILGEKYYIFDNIYWSYSFDKFHDVINGTIATFVTSVWIYITYINRTKLLKSI